MARARNSSSTLLTLAALVVAIAALHLAKEILLPLALAILISFLLTPLANRLERLGLGRILSVISVVGVTFAILGMLGWIVTNQLVDLGDDLPRYKETLVAKIKEIRPQSKLFKDVSETIEDVQKAATEEEVDDDAEAEGKEDASSATAETSSGNPKPLTSAVPAESTPAADETIPPDSAEDSLSGPSLFDRMVDGFNWSASDAEVEEKPPVDVRIVGTAPSPLDQIMGWGGPLVGPLTTAGVAVVLVIFILLKREDQRNRLLRLFGSAHLHATTEALTDVTDRVSRYLRMQFLINAGYGVSVGLGLWFIGVPNAVMWGVLSFSLRFLPYIGPWLSAVMPLFVSIADSEGWSQPIMVVAWFTILELIVNNVAEPMLYGRSTGVSGVGVIVAAIFWTWIWGPIGLVLAMPLTVCVVVMAKYIPALHFLTVLLGDQPPMADEERIYQRLLAGDTLEARELLLERLKESTLADVYDKILIPAIRLAERDRHAGLLHDEQEQAVEETARDLVDELGEAAIAMREEEQAADPAEVGGETPKMRILCIPLRDEADEISAGMLKQLLALEHVEVEMPAAEALTGEVVDWIESLKIDVAIISVLPPLPPRSSRLLCRRLRDRYPALPIIVGYWCGECPDDIGRRLCADDGEIVGTLAAAVERVRAISTRPKLAEKVG